MQLKYIIKRAENSGGEINVLFVVLYATLHRSAPVWNILSLFWKEKN